MARHLDHVRAHPERVFHQLAERRVREQAGWNQGPPLLKGAEETEGLILVLAVGEGVEAAKDL